MTLAPTTASPVSVDRIRPAILPVVPAQTVIAKIDSRADNSTAFFIASSIGHPALPGRRDATSKKRAANAHARGPDIPSAWSYPYFIIIILADLLKLPNFRVYTYTPLATDRPPPSRPSHVAA